MSSKQPEALVVCGKEERRHGSTNYKAYRLPVQEANAQSGKETDTAEWLGPGK